MKYGIAFLMFLVFGFGWLNASAQTETPVKKISGGVLNGKATSLPKPEYPAAARAVKASGAVNVQVTIDEQGNVVSAAAVSGHPLLRRAAEQAARQATFAPTMLSGQPVTVTGVIVYNFAGEVGATDWTEKGMFLGIAESKGSERKISLPVEFASESEQLNSLAGLSVEEQKIQMSSIISSIKSKLNAADSWRLEFGSLKGKIFADINNQTEILSNLAKFRDLAANKVEGVQEFEIARAVELAKFADKTELTAEDRQTIVRIFNQ